MPRLLPTLGFCLIAPALLLPAGCGGPAIVHVGGTVRHAGKPVPDLIVNFVPAEGRPSWGITDKEGNFTLVHDKKTPGAIRGTHRVYVKYRPHNPKEEIAIQQGKSKLPRGMQAILAKYGRLETTTLRYEITKDGQMIDIDLD